MSENAKPENLSDVGGSSPQGSMEEPFRRVVIQAAREGDLTLRQRVQLRLVMRYDPERLKAELLDQAVAEGKVASGSGSIDWDALAAFIKEVLPAVLQLIKLFM